MRRRWRRKNRRNGRRKGRRRMKGRWERRGNAMSREAKERERGGEGAGENILLQTFVDTAFLYYLKWNLPKMSNKLQTLRASHEFTRQTFRRE